MAFTDGTHAAYAATFLSKTVDDTSSLSTIVGLRRPLGVTPYLAIFLEELITWRYLQLYGPFMSRGASVGPFFYYNSSLRQAEASRLYRAFKNELRLERNSVCCKLARFRRDFSARAQEESELCATIMVVAGDVGISHSMVEKSLKLLKQFSAARYTTSPWPTAQTMAGVRAWDDLAKDIVEDHHLLRRHSHPVSRIIRRRTERLGLCKSAELLPAVGHCKEAYFARLLSMTDVKKETFDPDCIEYRLAPHLQGDDDTGVHMVVQLKKTGSTRSKKWKRIISYTDVGPKNNRSSYSSTTRRDSYGSYNPLRRVEARQPEKLPLGHSDSEGSREGLIQWETRRPSHAMGASVDFSDPLRQLEVGEEYGDAGHFFRMSRFIELLAPGE